MNVFPSGMRKDVGTEWNSKFSKPKPTSKLQWGTDKRMLAAARGSESGSGWSQVADLTLGRKHGYLMVPGSSSQEAGARCQMVMVVKLIAFRQTQLVDNCGAPQKSHPLKLILQSLPRLSISLHSCAHRNIRVRLGKICVSAHLSEITSHDLRSNSRPCTANNLQKLIN